MTFSRALEELKAGKSVRRKGWATAGAWIYLMTFTPDYNLSPCVCWCVPGKKLQPGWLCSQADMLADDWEVVIEG